MLLKNRVRDVRTNKIIGLERVVNGLGHWEHLRNKRQAWLLGAITSEDPLIREPFIGLCTLKGEELFENDKVKLYVNDSFGWRHGKIIWDEYLLSFFWVSASNILNGVPLRIILSGHNNLATLKFEL
jgi:hypothetical protein